MPLEYWIILWKVFLIGVVCLFGGMAVWVTIGGVYDIKRLFARIAASHEEDAKAESGKRKAES